MLVKNKTYFEDKLKELKDKGNVSFKGCANSMKRFNIDKSELISFAEIVPVAILEISEKQMEGWSYIKVGN
jgi:intracellular sulfur oxidation DsrE/DsrF family protein